MRTIGTKREKRIPINTMIIYGRQVVTHTRGLARALGSIATRTRVRIVATTTGILNKGCLGRYALCIAIRPYIVYTNTVT